MMAATLSAATACGTLRRHAASSVTHHRSFPAINSLFMSAKNSPPTTLSFRWLATVKEEKQKMKQRRTELWEYSQKRLENLKTRRDDRPVDGKKNAFREWFDKRRIYQEILDRKARQAKLDWTIRAAAILERLPVVTRDKPQWEIDYLNLKAYLGQFGKDYPAELGFNQYPKNLVMTDEELLELLPEGFTPAPRVTEADTNGNVRTLNRRLTTRVYLAVKQDEKWTFPTANLRDEETLLDATKRAVADVAGEKMELYCPSNCPMGVDMMIHSNEDQKKYGTYGTKTFFLRVQYDEGDVPKESGRDYGWLDRDEMTARVKETEGEYASKFYHYLL